MKTVFDFSNYKTYLDHVISEKPGRGRGMRARLAEVTRCNSAYISQVLNQSAHFSLEQAEELNEFLGHDPDGGEYFILLVQLARAGTARLRQRIEKRLHEISEKRLVLKNRVDIKRSLSELDQVRYYSAWYYAAVHIAVTTPELRDKDAISEYLGLSLKQVSEVLDFLVSVSLVQNSGGRYTAGLNRIFLGNDSAMISKHHTNWRTRAIQSLDCPDEKDLHLSTVVSVSRADVDSIREQIVKGIEEVRAKIKASVPEEELFCFGVDFFRI